MKRLFILAVIMLIITVPLTFLGCNRSNGNTSTSNDTGQTDQIPALPSGNTDTMTESAIVQIDYATDDLMHQFDSFHELVHVEEGEWLMIWTDIPVEDFDYIKVGNDVIEDRIVFFMEYIEHSIGELTPDKPFLVKTYGHWGTMPHYGVSYTDTDNVKRFFFIAWSGYDGSLFLMEFENIIIE